MTIPRSFTFLGITSLLWCLFLIVSMDAAQREVLSLDGTWQIAEGSLAEIPTTFDHSVPVPGLVDMATPAFAEVGVLGSKLREAFWYKRTFQVDKPISAVAQLKVHKAMFGIKIILNGVNLGEYPGTFTPNYADVKPILKQGANEILIRVGVFPEVVGPTREKNEHIIGWDYEKATFIPGIFDSVELIMTGTPHLDRVQAVPDIDKKSVTVHVWPAQPVSITVSEARTHRVVGEMAGNGPLTIPITDCRLWSPEDPFLYELSVRTTGDEITTRFGMRSFRLDPATGFAMLNGKPYFMRGTNVTLYRFMEDPDRGSLPWNEEWVRTLHRRYKDMHWNSIRYCIGFPPEFWYRIADEEGFLIQDEFPIWNINTQKAERVYDVDSLANQFRDWMQERWNHPCVVIWDACNETKLPDTGAALAKVRHLDFSNRPWDNGWSEPALPTDFKELHPYHYMAKNFTLPMLAGEDGMLKRKPGESPIIINEYGWLWLNRDGTPCSLTTGTYKRILGNNSTTEQRRHTYARYLAADTEVWRCRRGVAGVLAFCGLGYSRPPAGQTSDDWADVVNLKWEPEYYRYVRDSFAPIGLMIESWAEEFSAGKPQEFPVIVINDLEKEWKGELRLQLTLAGKVVVQQQRTITLPGFGTNRQVFTLDLPKEGGDFQLEATLLKTQTGSVSSLRDFAILTPQQSEERKKVKNGLAYGKPVTASSNLVGGGATSPQAVVDGQANTRWSSEFSDPQWLAVDLGSVVKISRVELTWEAYATSYTIQVSSDNQTWKDVYKTDKGKGRVETINFAPVEARWVRYYGTKRAAKFGHSLFEFRVFK